MPREMDYGVVIPSSQEEEDERIEAEIQRRMLRQMGGGPSQNQVDFENAQDVSGGVTAGTAAHKKRDLWSGSGLVGSGGAMLLNKLLGKGKLKEGRIDTATQGLQAARGIEREKAQTGRLNKARARVMDNRQEENIQDRGFVNQGNLQTGRQTFERETIGKVEEYYDPIDGKSILVQQRGDGTIIDVNTKEEVSVAGLSTRFPEERVKQIQARGQMGRMLGNLGELYNELGELGSAVDTTQSGPQNIANFVRSQASIFERAGGTETASVRNQIDSIKPLIINAVRAATGMGVKGMDTKAEMDFYMQAMGDPTRDIRGNLAAVIMLNQAYGDPKAIPNVDAYKADIDRLRKEYLAEKRAEKPPKKDKNAGWGIVKP